MINSVSYNNWLGEVTVLKIAVQENLVPAEGFGEKLRVAEELGFEGVEIWGRNLEERLDVLKDAVSTSKIPISTICAGYKGDLLGVSKDERMAAVKDIKFKLTAAAELGAVGLVVVPTFGKPKLPDLYPLYKSVVELERRLLVEELKEIGRHADDVGAYVLLEPLNRYETHFLNRLEQAVEICEELGFEYVKIMADFFHMNIEEADIAESIRRAGPYIKHVHLADSNRVLPGFGHTDFKPGFQALKESGFRNFMALECRVPEPRAENLRKSLKYLRSLI